MIKERAGRNRTITLSDVERLSLKQRLHTLTDSSAVNHVLDKTFHQDILEAITYIPKHFVDLLIIDPPYNLSKDFAGFKFKATDNEGYLTYVLGWLLRYWSY